MSRTHPDVPLDPQLPPFTLITLLAVTGWKWVVVALIPKKEAQKPPQAINNLFPLFSNINKQVAAENPGETVSYLHSGILFLPKIVRVFLNLICH